MEPDLSKYLNALEKGEKITLVLAGVILDGTLEEMVDNYVVMTDVTSGPLTKKQYHLTVPLEHIYAWGHKKKKKKEDKK